MPAPDQHADTAQGWGEQVGMVGLAYRKEAEDPLSRIHARAQLV